MRLKQLFMLTGLLALASPALAETYDGREGQIKLYFGQVTTVRTNKAIGTDQVRIRVIGTLSQSEVAHTTWRKLTPGAGSFSIVWDFSPGQTFYNTMYETCLKEAMVAMHSTRTKFAVWIPASVDAETKVLQTGEREIAVSNNNLIACDLVKE